MKAILLGILVCAGAWAAEPALPIDLGEGQSLHLVLVEAGGFIQGSPLDETGRGGDEPPHPVRLTEDYYLARTAVTRGQWERFIAETGYRTEAETGTSGGFGWDGNALSQRKEFTWRNPGFPQTNEHPVCLITFPDAEAFCRWFEKKSRRKTTLPTEAQWEYACRAGTSTPWHGGEQNAWHKRNAGDGTRPVTSNQANPWGLIIGGNVGEWCLDWYAPYDVSADADPRQNNRNLSEKPRRVLRGGSWLREPKNSRSAARYRADPRSRNADIGFRIMCEVGMLAPIVEAPLETTVTSPAEMEPTPHLPISDQVVHQRDHKLSGWLCLLVPVALLVFAIRIILRGRKASSPFTSTAPPVLPRSTPAPVIRKTSDGFWIHSPHPVGTPVRLKYWLGGAPLEQTLIYQPGPEGHFVFTGTAPDKVSVVGIGDISTDPSPPPVQRRPSSFGDHDGSRPSNFPPAY